MFTVVSCLSPSEADACKRPRSIHACYRAAIQAVSARGVSGADPSDTPDELSIRRERRGNSESGGGCGGQIRGGRRCGGTGSSEHAPAAYRSGRPAPNGEGGTLWILRSKRHRRRDVTAVRFVVGRPPLVEARVRGVERGEGFAPLVASSLSRRSFRPRLSSWSLSSSSRSFLISSPLSAPSRMRLIASRAVRMTRPSRSRSRDALQLGDGLRLLQLGERGDGVEAHAQPVVRQQLDEAVVGVVLRAGR